MSASMLGFSTLFGESSSPYDEIVEKVTAETCTTENWSLVLDICDRVVADQLRGAKMCLLSVRKRLNHRDPHVVLLALSLLDSLWSNCGLGLRREVSSREFSNELSSKATHSNRSIGEKTRSMIKKWAENECKHDASLGLIETLYKNLLIDGHSFDTEKPQKPSVISNDPNVVHSNEEEIAIAKAIANSLEDANRQRASNTYPISPVVPKLRCEREVRALYDFEAVEDNELTFLTGDLIIVTDDSDQNWWKGRSNRGEGLFPASFVTSDLGVIKNEAVEPALDKRTEQSVPVARIDKVVLVDCLRMLEDCDPTGERPDPPLLADLEQRSLAQAPLIDARLAEIDRQHNALAQVDIAIRDVLAMYDSAVQQVQYQVQQPNVRMPQQPMMSNTTVAPQQQWDTAAQNPQM